jgi:hypothetical protein
VGTLFLGKDPPRGFEAHPDGHFLLPDEMPPQPKPLPVDHYESPASLVGSRTAERLALLVNLLVQHADAKGAILQEELTVSDNLSEGGAELRTSLELASGDVIQVREVDGSFETRAEVCETTMGPDGIRRLHVRFLDGRRPTHLIRKR